MKSYTDIEQSKKLAEILPIESADMHYATWTILDGEFIVSPNQGSTIKSLQEDYGNQIIPCWSLAALLEQFEDAAGLAKDYGFWFCYDNRKSCYTKHYDNPVDACGEMIEKLKNKGLI